MGEQTNQSQDINDANSVADKLIAQQLSSVWWVLLIRGILLVALGLYALFQPGLTLVAYIQVLAIFILIDGVMALVASAMGWAESRAWVFVRGVLAIFVALFVLAHPLLVGAVTLLVLIFSLALQLVIGGCLEIGVAIRERREIDGAWWMVLSGVLTVLFGCVLLACPFSSGAIMIRVLGCFGIILGIALVGLSFQVRALRLHPCDD